MNRDAISRFFRTYSASGVGDTPAQAAPAGIGGQEAAEASETVDLDVEDACKGLALRESSAKHRARPANIHMRFIDGSLRAMPVLCLRSPTGLADSRCLCPN